MRVTALVSALAVLGAFGAPAAAGPAATAAAEPGVEVSLDGAAFSSAPEEPLFRDPPIVVPGDVVSSRVWVRNASDRAAVVRFSGTGAWSTSAVLSEKLLVSAGVAGDDDRAALPIGESIDCAVLYTGPLLPPGGVVALEVLLAFASDTTGRGGHDARVGIDFVAALRDPGEPAGRSADCAGTVIPGLPIDEDADPSAGLPGVIASTGVAALTMAGLSGAALLAGSTLLGFAAYRRRRIRTGSAPSIRGSR